VPSRRLGSSLGVDVAPFKVCSYDCTYCQLGPTRRCTTQRTAFFPVATVLAEVKRRLQRWPQPDVVTVAGSGEPTLFAGLGELIDGIKRSTDVPVALLTNGSLFHRADVRAETTRADIVLPSLDAGDEETFRSVNRPARGLTLERVVGGLEMFRREYSGQIWLEVMVLAGITDTPASVSAIARLAGRIAPDRIQLNTPVRPTFDERAAPVPAARLTALARFFSPSAEVIADWPAARVGQAEPGSQDAEGLLALLSRRSCTVEDISGGLGLHVNAVVKVLGALERRGVVHRVLRDGRVFWHAIPGAPSPARARAR
jgi:wyosine [tRNA(Phe)-imidazoG37] synthetase (radical SAM superfamily)